MRENDEKHDFKKGEDNKMNTHKTNSRQTSQST